MKRRISILELLVAVPIAAYLYSVEQSLGSAGKEWFLLAFGFVILKLKQKAEGNRWNIAFIFIAYILAVCQKLQFLLFLTQQPLSTRFIDASIVFTVLYVIVLIIFPVYEIPKLIPLSEHTARYQNVSCKEFSLEKNMSRVTVFYPATEGDNEQQSSAYEAVMLENDYWDNAFATVKRSFPWFPLSILHFAGSFYQRYSIRILPSLPLIKKKNLKAIVFSHGLAASRNAYSIIHKQLASIGYVVFSVEHYDVLREESVEQTKDKQVKKRLLQEIKAQELETRLQVFKEVLDIINNSAKLNEKFGEEISIDATSIIAMGHSFGGATAQLASVRYPQFIRAAVCLDPWLFPLNENDLNTPISVPMLYITSETFSQHLPWSDIIGKNESVWKKLQKKEMSMYCMIKGMDHVCQGDQALLFAREMQLGRLIRSPNKTVEFNLQNTKIIEYFLANIVFNAKAQESKSVYDESRYLKLIDEQILRPLKRDSFEYFRQEFLSEFNQSEIFTFEFRGDSPF